MTDDTKPPDPETIASPDDEKPEVDEPISQESDTAEPDPDRYETRRHSRTLERPLTDEEKLKIGDEMATAMELAGQLEAKKKAIDDELKADIGKHWEKAGTLASALRKGRREAMIECETRRDYKAGTVEVVRLDTGDVVEPLRAMTAAERQVSLYGPTGRASEPEIITPEEPAIVNPGSWAEEADLDHPQDQQTLGIVAPPPSPADAIAQTAREEAPDA